jgi:hypothetical protein
MLQDVREIKFRIATAKAAFNKKTLFVGKLDLNLRKKSAKCCNWNTALCGADFWTLRNVDQTHLESFEMLFWREMEKLSWARPCEK